MIGGPVCKESASTQGAEKITYPEVKVEMCANKGTPQHTLLGFREREGMMALPIRRLQDTSSGRRKEGPLTDRYTSGRCILVGDPAMSGKDRCR